MLPHLPLIWAQDLVAVGKLDRNMAFGRGSTTRPRSRCTVFLRISSLPDVVSLSVSASNGPARMSFAGR